MKHFYLLFFAFVFSLFTLQNANATICMSVQNGAWGNAATWSCGRAPACGDTIRISHLVQITATVDLSEPGCTTPTFIVIQSGGDLNFDSGRKLSLACGSGVTIQTGGQMTSDAGGASENLKICNTIVWQGSWDADLDGPVVLGSGLPIELISFNAYYNGDQVDIAWTTASENNNDFFTVERSTDGFHYTPIIITNGAGNSSVMIDYFEVDFSPLQGTSYYRLVQTDFNGISVASNPIVVKSYIQFAGEISLYPNPTDGAFHILLSGFGDEEFIVVVRDLAGREHFSKVFVTSTDEHIEAIDPSNKLAAGTYVVTASSRNEFYTQKLVIK